ncbi:hypothetical protein [Thalassotalea crassostreae]|uniref:hypothetical protein n=1 Tax=Thalassotalea crassostreae TaxID=1763536 RepID=UPI00083996CB|nr:hypothetical protein [Thalassotalea crassostreae]
MKNVTAKACLLVGLMACGTAMAEQSDLIEPIIETQSTNVDIHSADWEIGIFGGAANLDGGTTHGVFGARLAYHLTENFFAEASYSVTGHEPEVKYLDGVLGYNFHSQLFVSSDYRFNTSLFFVGGGGYTELENGSEFKTIVGGAGYRVMLDDKFSMRFDLRGHLHHQLDNDEEWALDAVATLGMAYYF